MTVTPVKSSHSGENYPNNLSPKSTSPKFPLNSLASSHASPLLNVTDLTGSLPLIESPSFQSLKKKPGEESKVPPSAAAVLGPGAHNRATEAFTLDEYREEELSAFPPDLFVFNELCEDSFRFYDNCDKLGSIVDPALLNLRLCRCGRISSQLRARIENAAIDAIITYHGRDALITIVSVGSGGCYQELVYLSRLAKAGYRNFQLVLIEPKAVPLESLTAVCRKYLPQCNLEAIHYSSLENYKQHASQKKPTLLLLLDLTEETYYLNKTPLPDYCFKLFHENHLMDRNTIIAWNVVEDTRNPEEPILSIGCCGLYDETEESLRNLSRKKKAGTHEVIGRSELPPYKRVFTAAPR